MRDNIENMTAIKDALEVVRGIVSAHGITHYMQAHSKNTLSHPLDLGTTSVRYEFSLDTSQPYWVANNPSCTLAIDYSGGDHYDVSGDTHRNYKAKIRLQYSSGEVSLQNMKPREDMMSTIMLVAEMINAVIPQKITVVTETFAQKEEASRQNAQRLIGDRIGKSYGRLAMKGIRSGGKKRTLTFPAAYLEKYGEPPPEGSYPFKQIRRWNRRGDAVEVVNYTLFVHRVNSQIFVDIERVKPH